MQQDYIILVAIRIGTWESDQSLAKYGKIIKLDSLRVELAVNRTKATLVAKQILDDFPVEDINIEEPEAEEVVREVFQKKIENRR